MRRSRMSQVRIETLRDRKGDDFRAIIGMMLTDFLLDRLKVRCPGLDNKEDLLRALELTFPPEEGFDSWDQIDAGRQALVDQHSGQRHRIGICANGRQHDDRSNL